ncbi:magnesium chelatase subunit D [Methylobacterium sp. J-076]|uniref:magnesium chelatase subunit D n=1 Tax=Methylobacterium sp. J-076 TaxID=2836655 RepID=UPI001FB87DA8|nr:magnesium chelatase subunit D [Methylobacterium sp. J-076]MCJ2013303.1 magnesium chelatase subunit D [Methylobacterium sp. J-076]
MTPQPSQDARIPPAEGGGSAGVWADALLALRLFAADPHGLGGVVVRAGPGPVREAWLDRLRDALGAERPIRRMPPGTGDEGLLGGLDLAATLSAGRPVSRTGLLAGADGGVIVVPMAERLEPGTAARLAAALDTGRAGPEGASARFGLVLLDEGQGDEAAPAALADRLAFRIDLDAVPPRLAAGPDPASEDAGPEEGAGGDPVALLCTLADAFGIASPRAPILALRVARALAGEGAPPPALAAARLVLAPRAERLPEPGPAPEPPPPPEGERTETPPSEGEATEPAPPEDVVLDAVRAAIPPRLIESLLTGGPRASQARAGRGGRPEAVSRTGRPVGSRPGDPRRHRLDLLATLRAAAPWQALRRAGAQDGALRIRRDDLRVRKLRRRVETTTVFCVDASGSAALERLAEAKGAVEALLAEAYVRRDRVALVAFRGRGADLVLPPTRSLTRAKRGLAGLPGGGGTPLASGLDAALAVALGVRRGGGNPLVVVLTDGRANVARSGEGGRARAGEEAIQAARAVRQAGLAALVVDTGARGGGAKAVADAMDARYLALPRVDGGTIGAAVKAMR